MIIVSAIGKNYGKLKALNDFSFSMDVNDVIGFIGPNGAGKSTALKIITGCISPSNGNVTVNGDDIQEYPSRAKSKIGYMPEQPPLYTGFTVREYLNSIYDIKLLKMNRKQHIDDIAQKVGIENVLGRKIGNLSKGYCQRVGMAQALLGNPEYLVLDEPTSGLDPMQKADMLNIIKSLKDSCGIILSSHILSEIEAVCNKILMISNGKRVSFDSRNETRGKGFCYSYELLGSSKKALTAFKECAGIVGVKATENLNGITTVQIEADSDIREKMFYILAENKLPIVSCVDKSTALEKIFLERMGGAGCDRNAEKRT